MNDTQVDVLVASICPVSDRQVADLPLADLERDLLEGILSGAPAELAAPGGGGLSPEYPPLLFEARSRKARRAPHRALAGVVAAAAVVAVVVAAFVSRPPRSDPSVQADDPSARANESTAPAGDAAPGSWPHLVLDLPDWDMDRIDTVSDTEGSMSFMDSSSGGRRGLVLDWVPASEHDGAAPDAEVLSPRQVAGVEAVVSHITHTPGNEPDGSTAEILDAEEAYRLENGNIDRFEATWLLDGFSLTAAGVFTSEDEFVQVLTALRKVELDRWLDAAPEAVIWPGDQAAIDAMLADIPLPPGFDASSPVEERVRSRDWVRGEVAQAVACGWVESWISATDAGDAAGVQQAVDAMAGSGDWAIVKEPDTQADQFDGELRQLQFDEIRTLADAMPTDAVIPLTEGPRMTVRELYANWLECPR